MESDNVARRWTIKVLCMKWVEETGNGSYAVEMILVVTINCYYM